MSKVSFTPNTITYTAKGPEAEKIKKSKMGIVVHTQYHGNDIHSMKADPHPDTHNFGHHPDVWHKSAEHDTRKVDYPEHDQTEFHKHMAAAKRIHDKHGTEMYKHTEQHQGAGGHLEQYINHTVRGGETPSAKGFREFRYMKNLRNAEKYRSNERRNAEHEKAKAEDEHIAKHAKHYENLLQMHHHLQQAKDILVNNLNKHKGGLEHHIDTKKTEPEGFVVHHGGQPSKLVNRAEFSKANLLKARK